MADSGSNELKITQLNEHSFEIDQNPDLIQISSPFLDIRGLSTGRKNIDTKTPNADKVSVKQHGDRTVIAVVDGIIPSSGEGQEEELKLVTESAELLSSQSTIDSNTSDNISSIQRPFAWAKLTPNPETGKTHVDWTSQGNIAILAFNNRWHASQFIPIYLGVGNYNDKSESGSIDIADNWTLLIATNGGIAALSNQATEQFLNPLDPSVALSSEHEELARKYYTRLIKNPITSQEKIQIEKDFELLVDPLKSAIQRNSSPSAMRELGKFLLSGKPTLTNDATLIGVDMHPQNKEAFYSASVLPLFDELRKDPDRIPNQSSEKIVRQFGVEQAVRLMEEMIDKGITQGRLFARVCSLISKRDLTPKIFEYLQQKGLVELPYEIKVNPIKHNEGKADICQDLGIVTFFDPHKYYGGMILNDLTREMKANVFKPMDIIDNFPEGVWAQYNHVFGQNVTFPAAYIMGSSGRGILVPPSDSVGVYIHNPHTHEGTSRSFFFIQNIHPFSLLAMYAYANFLRNPELNPKLKKRS